MSAFSAALRHTRTSSAFLRVCQQKKYSRAIDVFGCAKSEGNEFCAQVGGWGGRLPAVVGHGAGYQGGAPGPLSSFVSLVQLRWQIAHTDVLLLLLLLVAQLYMHALDNGFALSESCYFYNTCCFGLYLQVRWQTARYHSKPGRCSSSTD